MMIDAVSWSAPGYYIIKNEKDKVARIWHSPDMGVDLLSFLSKNKDKFAPEDFSLYKFETNVYGLYAEYMCYKSKVNLEKAGYKLVNPPLKEFKLQVEKYKEVYRVVLVTGRIRIKLAEFKDENEARFVAVNHDELIVKMLKR